MFSYFHYRAYQLRPSKKIPKWCPIDEVQKTWITNSTKQADLEEAANQGNAMDASFDCKLNLYVNFETHFDCKLNLYVNFETHSLYRSWCM